MTRRALLAAVLAPAAALMPFAADAAGGAVVLAPHRAVYDMQLDQARAGSGVSAVKGRMVYELTGSTCEGWTQTMRFVTEMSGADGQVSLTDLRSATFEDGAARIFRFDSSQQRDQKTTEQTAGNAMRSADGVKVDLTKPQKKTLDLKTRVYFPIEHSVALIAAARDGKSQLRADLYDGSEKGDKLYDTSAFIGREKKPGANKTLPAAKSADLLDALSAWPVTISYYEPGKGTADATPVYELGFLFFENGVSRKLTIDYGDFAIKGEMKEIAFLEQSKCDGK